MVPCPSNSNRPVCLSHHITELYICSCFLHSLSIQALLGAPNPDDPLANDVAQNWKENQSAAIAQAREWTQKYAH